MTPIRDSLESEENPAGVLVSTVDPLAAHNPAPGAKPDSPIKDRWASPYGPPLDPKEAFVPSSPWWGCQVSPVSRIVRANGNNTET